MDKRIFEMPVRVGGVLWLKDEPYKPFHVIGYRIGRMMGEEEEEWYMQLCGEGADVEENAIMIMAGILYGLGLIQRFN